MANETVVHRILDVGIGRGEYSIRLAELGHTVVGITNCKEEYKQAKRTAQRRGLGNCTFMHMCAQDLGGKFDPGFFDTVIASRVLHLLPNQTTPLTIDTLKSLTAPGGWHIIQGYLVDPALSRSKTNREKMFKPGELQRVYAEDIGWQITNYVEDTFSRQIAGDQEWVSSLAKMTARKSKIPRSR